MKNEASKKIKSFSNPRSAKWTRLEPNIQPNSSNFSLHAVGLKKQISG